MATIRRILGKRGRTTIPYEFRQILNMRCNDVLTFAMNDDRNCVVITKEKNYDKVFDAQADVETLEDAFILFNQAEKPPLFYGHSMSVSDVVVAGKEAFYCDSFGFQKIKFDESHANSKNFIKVLFVRPHEEPYIAQIPDTLEAKQQAVGGYIEYVYNSDETALVGDEEAKLKNKEGNRYLDGGGIIAGDFLVVGFGDEDCRSFQDNPNHAPKVDIKLRRKILEKYQAHGIKTIIRRSFKRKK